MATECKRNVKIVTSLYGSKPYDAKEVCELYYNFYIVAVSVSAQKVCSRLFLLCESTKMKILCHRVGTA